MSRLSLLAACGLLVLAAAPTAEAATCGLSVDPGQTPGGTVTIDLASGEDATVSTQLVGGVPTLVVAPCTFAVDATLVRTVTVTGDGGRQSLTYAPAPGVPFPASAFADPWTIDLGGGTTDLVVLGPSASTATTRTVGTLGIDLDGGVGSVELTIPGVDAVRLVGGAGGDVLSGMGGGATGDAATIPLDVRGGAGEDLLAGGAAGDEIAGGPDDDLLTYAGRAEPLLLQPNAGAVSGGAGEGDAIGDDIESLTGGDRDDRLDLSFMTGAVDLDGGPGDDVLISSTAGEVIRGGAGVDRVSYEGRTGRVTSDPDGAVGDDGAAGEGDSVQPDVEGAIGGRGDDRLVSSATPLAGIYVELSQPLLAGGEGADELVSASPTEEVGAPIPIDGGPGPDRLLGGDGPELLIGGTGGDVLDGGVGFDVVSYEGRARGVVVSVGGSADDGEPGEGDDVRGTVEEVVGTEHDDRITAGARSLTAEGRGGADRLTGGPAGDRLDGGAGRDAIDALGGDDRAFGDIGDDVIRLGAGDDVAVSFPLGSFSAPPQADGADVIEGGAGRDVLAVYEEREAPVRVFIDGVANDGAAGEGDRMGTDFEEIRGGLAGDLLVGGPAGERFLPGPGSDEVRGGGGVDAYVWSTSGFGRQGRVTIRLDGLRNDGLPGEGDLIGADVENADAGSALGATVVGNAGPNVLVGTSRDDELRGGGGSDRLVPRAGGDLVDGGAGLDVLDLDDPGADEAPIAASVDLAAGTMARVGAADRGTVAGIEEVRGTRGADVLRGGRRADVLVGRGGADLLDGRDGADELDAGEGADVLLGGVGDDVLDGGADGDRALGGAGADEIAGGLGGDVLAGGAGPDAIGGGGGADRLAGDAGADVLRGGPGADAIAARGGGRDSVDGGPGRDRATLDRTDVRRSIERVVRRLAALVGG